MKDYPLLRRFLRDSVRLILLATLFFVATISNGVTIPGGNVYVREGQLLLNLRDDSPDLNWKLLSDLDLVFSKSKNELNSLVLEEAALDHSNSRSATLQRRMVCFLIGTSNATLKSVQIQNVKFMGHEDLRTILLGSSVEFLNITGIDGITTSELIDVLSSLPKLKRIVVARCPKVDSKVLRDSLKESVEINYY